MTVQPSGNVREEVTTSFFGSEVEGIVFFQLLGVHVSEDLCWTTHTTAALKTAHERLDLLRRLRRVGQSAFARYTFDR